jgi:hypothetical protein
MSSFGVFGKCCAIISQKMAGFSLGSARGASIHDGNCSPGAGAGTFVPRVATSSSSKFSRSQ